jgi:hypothetical protein
LQDEHGEGLAHPRDLDVLWIKINMRGGLGGK